MEDALFTEAIGVMEKLLSWLGENGFTEIEGVSYCSPQQVAGKTPQGLWFYYRVRHGQGFIVAGDADSVDDLLQRYYGGSEEEAPEIVMVWDAHGTKKGFLSYETAVSRLKFLLGGEDDA